jgi:hypothetical protein
MQVTMRLQYTEAMLCVTRCKITEIQMVHYGHCSTACLFLIEKLQSALSWMPHISQYSKFPVSITRSLRTF